MANFTQDMSQIHEQEYIQIVLHQRFEYVLRILSEKPPSSVSQIGKEVSCRVTECILGLKGLGVPPEHALLTTHPKF